MNIENLVILAFIAGVLLQMNTNIINSIENKKQGDHIPIYEYEYEAPVLSSELPKLVEAAARRHGIDPLLLAALVKQESRWNPRVVSHAGAIGLAQIMPATGKSFCKLSRLDLYDAKKNINCGAAYFAAQLQKFGTVTLALCAYNAGPHRVQKLGRCPTFTETNQYVKKILTTWKAEGRSKQHEVSLLTN